MIRSVDNSGNSIEHQFNPAFMIRNIMVPTANDDELRGIMNKSILASSIVSNDKNPYGSCHNLQVIITSDPVYGELSLAGLNALIYNPETDYSGNDQFSYKVKNEKYVSNEATVNLVVADPSSITLEEETAGIWLRCYPNPVSSVLFLELVLEEAQEINLELLDINGQLVVAKGKIMANAGSNHLTMSVAQLRSDDPIPGIYFLRVTTESTCITEKIIVR